MAGMTRGDNARSPLQGWAMSGDKDSKQLMMSRRYPQPHARKKTLERGLHESSLLL